METQPLNQQNTRWINTELGTGRGYTIGRYGCALTDLTMVANLAGRSVTPDKLNLELVNVGGFASNGTTNSDGSTNNTLLKWGAITQVYGEIQLQQNIVYPTTPANMDMVDSFLEHNNPVIVGVAFDHNTKTTVPTHYVLLYKKDANGNYWCYDPWFGDSANFNSRYAVNGMTVGQCILQVVAYSIPAPTPAQPAPEAAHPQQAVTPTDVAQNQADQNYNLYMQEVATNKTLNDRIGELQGQVTDLQKANNDLTTEIANTKTLNSTLSSQLSDNESKDSAAIEDLQKQIEILKEKEQIANTTAEVLQTKPKLQDVLSGLDNLLSIKEWASKFTGRPKPQPQNVLQILGLISKEVK